MTSDELELLADLVADRLADRLAPAGPTVGLVDAKTLAQLLGVSADFVRDHAVELGGQKLTAAAKAPWRFDVDAARARMASRAPGMRPDRASAPVGKGGRARQRQPRRQPGGSLAIRGEEP